MCGNTQGVLLTREAHLSSGGQSFHLGLHGIGMADYVARSPHSKLLWDSGQQRHSLAGLTFQGLGITSQKLSAKSWPLSEQSQILGH